MDLADGRPTSRTTLSVAVALVLGLATAVGLVVVTGRSRVMAVLGDIDGVALAGIALVQVVALGCLVQVYRGAHAVNGGRIGFRDATAISLGAFSLTQALPGGGAVGGLYAIRRLRALGVDGVGATTTVVLVGLVSMGTLGLMLATATTVTAVVLHRWAGYAVVGLVALAVVAAVLGMLHAVTRDGPAKQRLMRGIARLPGGGGARVAGWLVDLEGHQGLLRHPRALAVPVGWSSLNWGLEIAVLAGLLHLTDAKAPVLGVLVAFAVANLLNAVPLTPGGIGVLEAGLVGTLVGFGADSAAASVAVLAYRAVAHWAPAIAAGPVVALTLRRSRDTTGVAA